MADLPLGQLAYGLELRQRGPHEEPAFLFNNFILQQLFYLLLVRLEVLNEVSLEKINNKCQYFLAVT